MKIAVLGSGNVGGTLARAWKRAGHAVVLGTRTGQPDEAFAGLPAVTVRDAIRDAEIVVLAVPWAAAADVLKQASGWHGKILVDCTNPITPGFELAAGWNTSGGEQVAVMAPGAAVVKAFNTTGFGNMANPVYAGQPVSMLFCTEDKRAAGAAEQLVRDIGFEPVNAGPLTMARLLEPLAMLWIKMSFQHGRDFAFTLVRR